MKSTIFSRLNNLDKRTDLLLSILVCIISLCSFIWLIRSHVARRYPEARQEMRHFMSRVQLGDTKAQVQHTFDLGAYKSLKLRDSFSSGIWSVNTPWEFGSGNWVLYIEFNNDKVVALRVRMIDDARFRPRDTAPGDKVLPGWNKPFPLAH